MILQVYNLEFWNEMRNRFLILAALLSLVLGSCAKEENSDVFLQTREEIAALHSALDALSLQITEMDGRKADTSAVKGLDDALSSLASAVSALRSRTDAQFAALSSVQAAAAGIMAEIEALDDEVAELRLSLDAVSASTGASLSLIQSIALVPKCAGRRAVIENPASMTLDYELFPRRFARIVAEQWSDAGTVLRVNCRRVAVRSSAPASSLPITSVAFDEADSLLQVTVDISALMDEFWSSADVHSVNLTVSDGDTPIISSAFSDIFFACQPLPPSGLPLVLGDTARFSVVCPSGSSETAREAAAQINAALGQYSAVVPEVKASSAGEDAWEIIVGEVPYQPADSLYRQLTYGSYMVHQAGRKILLAATAMDANAYQIIAGSLTKIFGYNYDAVRRSLVLDEDLFSEGIQSTTGIKGYVPPFITDKFPDNIFQTGASTNDDVAMQVDFSGCGDSHFDKYCSALAATGFHTACTDSFGKCRYATYVNDEYQISVSLYNQTGLFRVVSEPVYQKPIWTIGGKPGNEQPLMYQCYSLLESSAFNAYVIRLPDGRFVLNDVGAPDESSLSATVDQMMEYMRSRNVFTDGKVHIALIILTHRHFDHIAGLSELANRYASEIVCEGLAFNLTHPSRQSYYSTGSMHTCLNNFRNSAAKLGAQCYCVRAGQTVDLSGDGRAKFEVLFTPDELGTLFLDGSGSYYDQNNSSVITRLTVDGQEITFTGDCRGGEADKFDEILLSSFTSDIMTAAHHGFNTNNTWYMYRQAKPCVIFWPCTRSAQDMTRSFDQHLMNDLPSIKKHFFLDEPVEIELPYWPE